MFVLQVEEEEPQIVQTAFTVKLTGFDEKQKIALIKELKGILPDCNLVQVISFGLYTLYLITFYRIHLIVFFTI